jgi:hypothetical protein
MHDAPGVAHLVELQDLAAQAHRLADLAREPAGIDFDFGIRLEDAHGDARVAVVEAAADPVAFHADHVDDAARLGPHGGLFDEFLENPGMRGPPGIAQADVVGARRPYGAFYAPRPCPGEIAPSLVHAPAHRRACPTISTAQRRATSASQRACAGRSAAGAGRCCVIYACQGFLPVERSR